MGIGEYVGWQQGIFLFPETQASHQQDPVSALAQRVDVFGADAPAKGVELRAKGLDKKKETEWGVTE